MGFVVVSPRVEMTHEELGVAQCREEYVRGEIAVEEFERRVERVLHGDLSVIPMGGMPMFDAPAMEGVRR